MPDYYTSDATQHPYSWILRGGGEGWPLSIRLVFAIRKATRLHYSAAHGRSKPQQWCGIELEDLPKSARACLEAVIAEFSELDFQLFGTIKSDTIGQQADYNAVLISVDRSIVGTINAQRIGIAEESRSVVTTGLRTDLANGAVILTGRGLSLPSHMFRPHHEVEMMSDSESIVDLVERHHERLKSVSSKQIIVVPKELIEDYLMKLAIRDWDDFMAAGMFRKLSRREVANLRNIQFDFE